MDYMSGFPSTKHGNDCVFVVINRFYKMAILEAYKKSIIAEATVKLFFVRVSVHFQIPQLLSQIQTTPSPSSRGQCLRDHHSTVPWSTPTI